MTAKTITPYRSDLPFASLLTYSPRGESRVSVRSRRVVRYLKTDHVQEIHGEFLSMSTFLVRRLAEELPHTPFPRWFDDAVLVPMPRSRPLKPGALWPSWEIARKMVERGLGGSVVACLTRSVAVQKAAFSGSGERPGPTVHFDSLSVTSPLPLGTTRVVLVDDVVTRGSMFIGATRRLRASFEKVEIAAFAAVRTMSDGDIEAILAPCVGTILCDDDRVTRRP